MLRNLKKRLVAIGSCVVLLFFSALVLHSQQRSEQVVIAGVTVIDGTGGPPRPDLTIVISGGRIQEIGPSSQVRHPAGTTVIDARGKFIIPGFTDAHVHYHDWYPELLLAHGVTTVMDLSADPYWTRAQKEAIAKGEIPGPRLFFAGDMLAGGGYFSFNVPLRGREDAIRATRREIEELRTDYIKLHADVTPELVKAACEEAHRLGKRCIAHLGARTNAREAALAGIDMLAHGSGIAGATVTPEARKQAGRTPTLLGEPYPLMQRELFADLISLLVQKGVYIEPDISTTAKGIHPLSGQFALENQLLLADAELSYVPDNPRRRWFTHFPFFQRLAEIGEEGASLAVLDKKTKEALDKGYENLVLFLQQFVKAGGKLVMGTDAQHFVVPGISVHQELELLVHSKIFSPQQAIVSATKTPAEFLGRLQDFGTIEKGKLADLVILNSDPLQDIRNTRDIFEVFQEGRKVDRTYHRYFTNPLPRPQAEFGGENPSPRIDEIKPPLIVCGGDEAKLEIHGKGFIAGSFVKIDNIGQDIEFISPTEIRTKLNCKTWKSPSLHEVKVVNPKPIYENGVDTSESLRFVSRR